MTQQPWGGQPQQGYAPQQQQYAPQQGYAPQQQAPWGGQQAGHPQQAPQQHVAVETGDSFDDFFTGGVKGAPGFDFGATQNGGEKLIGAMVMGEIVEMARMQQRDYATNQPLTFDDGSPRMQVAITLQTELRGWQGVKPKLVPKDEATGQPQGPEKDTGLRRVFVKGDMVRAINVACAQAANGGPVQKPRKGGKLAVAVRGFEPTQKGNDKVLYDAQYVPAPEVAPTDSFFTQAPPAQQAPPAPGAAFAQAAPQQAGWAQQAGQPPAPQQLPQQAFANGQAPVVAGYEIQPQQGGPVPGTNPSTLGQGQAPTQAPDFAQQAPQQTPPPAYAAPGTPAGYDAPPF